MPDDMLIPRQGPSAFLAMLATFPGSSKERQEVGLPGHCDRCVALGHEVAHPRLGCADVGCYSPHGREVAQDD